jgi:hypothetical protein
MTITNGGARWSFVPSVLGVVLFAAGAADGHDLVVSARDADWPLLIRADFELFGGFWLLSGRFSRRQALGHRRLRRHPGPRPDDDASRRAGRRRGLERSLASPESRKAIERVAVPDHEDLAVSEPKPAIACLSSVLPGLVQ